MSHQVRYFHASRGANAWFMAPVARVAVAVSARLGRKLWKRIGDEKRQAVKDALMKRTGFIVGGVSVVSAGAVGYYYSHIEEAPVTKRSRFMMVNRQKLVEMIEQEKDSVISLLTVGHAVLPASHPAYGNILSILNRIIPVLMNHWSGGALIIIKHPLGFYSAYAQNHTLRAINGEEVQQADIIALTGKTDFHFKMRKFKTPIDPLKYLKR